MSPLGGTATLSPVDRRATIIGRICAVVCVASVVIAGFLLLSMAGNVVAARTWPYAALFGTALGAWVAALLTMLWHQARVGLSMQDSDDWDRRAGGWYGFLAPSGTCSVRRINAASRDTRGARSADSGVDRRVGAPTRARRNEPPELARRQHSSRCWQCLEGWSLGRTSYDRSAYSGTAAIRRSGFLVTSSCRAARRRSGRKVLA